jgi:hypothetical protein
MTLVRNPSASLKLHYQSGDLWVTLVCNSSPVVILYYKLGTSGRPSFVTLLLLLNLYFQSFNRACMPEQRIFAADLIEAGP